MKISIKAFQVNMEIGNNGIEIDVYTPDGKTHKGDLRIGRGTIEWCKGSVRKGNGVKKTWTQLIDWFES